jgi:putative ABC transport system permease protein
VTPVIYTIDAADNLAQIHPNSSLDQQGNMMASLMANTGSGGMTTFSEMIEPDRMKEEYTVAYGKWPEKYNELAVSVNDPNQISDLLLYSLGFETPRSCGTLSKTCTWAKRSLCATSR